jgi:tRNA 2-thiocytidine biosynthesis protein TtcA
MQSTTDANLRARRLHFLFRRVAAAQREYGLVTDGDRVLIALSGGKDSMSLCHLMAHWRDHGPERFELAALHAQVAGNPLNTASRDLIAGHLAQLRIPVHFAEMDHSEFYQPEGANIHNCFRCAWKRRKEIFSLAAEDGYNKVAFGHHLDDAAETVLMNLQFHGRLDGMEPKREFFGGKVTLIRPLILAEEKEVIRLSSTLGFPFYGCLCPADHESARDAARDYIRSFGRTARAVKTNIWRASRARCENQKGNLSQQKDQRITERDGDNPE